VKPDFDWDARNSRSVSVEGRRSDSIGIPSGDDHLSSAKPTET
jgi:hypothetical protein